MLDPHIHLFDVAGTPRPVQPLAKAFGWNERVLRAVAAKAFPASTLAFFGERNHLVVDYLTDHYRTDSASSGVTDYVHIEAGWKNDAPLDAVGETEWLETLADPPAAIVAHADLSLGADVGSVLAAHLAASDRVRGIRYSLSHHPADAVIDFADDGDMSRTSAFRNGYEQLAEHGLSFDAWAYGHQLDQVADLAGAVPEVPLVLCHCGTPAGLGGDFFGVGGSETARDRIAKRWRDGIAAVAAQPNSVVKLSGLLMPVLGFGFERRDNKPTASELVDKLGPLIRECIDAFGPDRCMVASNFPVDRVSADYATWMAAMREITEQDGEAANAAMYDGTARAFYRVS